MSKKRLATAVLVVILLGAIGLVCLYVTLGRMNALMKSRAGLHASSHSALPADARNTLDSQSGNGLKLTPIGEAQLRQAASPPQPSREGDSSTGGAAPVTRGATPPEKQPGPATPPQ